MLGLRARTGKRNGAQAAAEAHLIAALAQRGLSESALHRRGWVEGDGAGAGGALPSLLLPSPSAAAGATSEAPSPAAGVGNSDDAGAALRTLRASARGR